MRVVGWRDAAVLKKQTTLIDDQLIKKGGGAALACQLAGSGWLRSES